MGAKAKLAVKYYTSGYNCAQAVLSAYAEEMGISHETAYRMMEGYGGGFGFMQEVCGAFAGAAAVIGFYASDGKLDKGKTKPATAKLIREAAKEFRAKHCSIICREVLRGNGPKPMMCAKKVYDATLIVEDFVERIQKEKAAE